MNIAVASAAYEFRTEERFVVRRCPAGLQHAPLVTMSQAA